MSKLLTLLRPISHRSGGGKTAEKKEKDSDEQPDVYEDAEDGDAEDEEGEEAEEQFEEGEEEEEGGEDEGLDDKEFSANAVSGQNGTEVSA